METKIICTKCGKELPTWLNASTSPFAVAIGNKTDCPHCGTINDLPTTEKESDFKFEDLELCLRTMRYYDLKINSEELKDVVNAFVQNMHRVVGLGLLPELLALNLAVATNRISDPFPVRHGDLPAIDGDALFMRIVTVSRSTDRLLDRVPNEGTYLALEGLLSSVIVGTWTAFETLAGDLWEAAINANPECMFEHTKSPKGAKPSNKPKKKPESKLVELWDIKNLEYDLRGKVGTVLKGTVNFTSIDGMRDAYRRVFQEKHISKILKDPAVEMLQIIRNCLVHKAGKIDHEFERRVESIPALNGFKSGMSVPLTGDFVAQRIAPVVDRAMSLIAAVDHWSGRQGK